MSEKNMKGIALSMDDLDKINGGLSQGKRTNRVSKQMMPVSCTKCKKTFDADVQKSSATCPFCGKINKFMG
ncbi:MAG: hypothetical protein K6B28_13395 [Lachnospiraceae bacterium]|nr:hypothetical protein [Lachnospiraceae bacterium]